MPDPLAGPQHPESVFTYTAPSLVFGRGAINDIAFHLREARKVLIVTDPGVARTSAVQRVIDTLPCQVAVWDDTHIEPTDESLRRIADYVRRGGRWDAFIAIGGGSSIDTAKAANLMFTNPGDLLAYVNAPIGGGQAPEQPLKPLIAVPTTTGTGSESTTICVLDVLDQHVKTGISHPALRPTLAVVDPDLSMTQPPMVTACAGLDILCHALESYTARPFTSFEAKTAEQRVPYCGANPISDMWAERALGLMAEAFIPAVRDYRPPDYPQDEPIIPHGMAVALTAPAAFRLTEQASPERHARAAHLLGGEDLPTTLRAIMDALGVPTGLRAVGYSEADIPDLVEGAQAQQRLLALAPLNLTGDDLAGIFEESM